MTTRLYLQVHNILGLRYRGKLRGFSTLKIRVQNQQNVNGKMDEKCRKLTIRPGWSIKKLFTRNEMITFAVDQRMMSTAQCQLDASQQR